MKNCPLSKYKVRKIIKCFCVELTATQTSKLLDINRNTVNRYYRIFRELIAQHQVDQIKKIRGHIEIDESYFGGRHKGNIGRSTKSKIPVFGLLKRNGKVYTQIVSDVSARTLKNIIKAHISKGSTVYSDSWKSYDGLVFNGYKHHRINHAKTLVAGKNTHINGIENFWSYIKNKLVKFYGISPKYFYLYLKEYEFRFNHKDENIELIIWNLVRNKYHFI